MATVQTQIDPAVLESRGVLEALFRPYGPRDFAVRFWDGSSWDEHAGLPCRFTIVLAHPGSLRRMFWPPSDLTVGEAYIFGDYDVEGDMEAFLAAMRRLGSLPRNPLERLALGWRLWRLPRVQNPRAGRQAVKLTGRRHSLERDRQAISYHYDLSNDFFALFLDPRLVYTAPYYHTPSDSLEAAQEQKLDYVCRKLDLKKGERLLDIGCGWGGLVTYAAEHYGVQAHGVTLSKAQAEFAQDQIRRRGLQASCRVEHGDYRNVPETTTYDKIATLEVLEHMGEAMYPVYFNKVNRLLRLGGRLCIQAITLTGPLPIKRWRKFIRAYVFPDGELQPISAIQRAGENVGLEVRDVESLREHYAAALKTWLDTLEARHDQAVQLLDESDYRTFRMYIAGARHGYVTATYNLHHALFVKPDQGKSGFPLTRAGM